MNDVQYMNSVRYMNDVKHMNSVQYMNSVQLMPDVSGLQNVTSFQYKPKRVRVFNDAGEKADSILDVVFGSAQRDVLLEEQGLGWTKDIPGINLITGTVALLDDKYADPVKRLVRGEQDLGQTGKEIFLNTLIEISEDLDILSNVVKSQNPLAGGEFGSLETLSDALGLNGKRVAYNFNTGNFFADVALEMVSDPLTVLEFASSIVGGAGKAGAKEVAESSTKELTEDLSEQAIKDYSQAVYKTVVKEGQEATFENVIKNVNRRSLQEISEANLKEITPEIIKRVSTSDGYKYFTSAAKFKSSVEKVDTALTKGAWALTPVGLPAKYAGPIIKDAAQAIYQNAMVRLEKFDLVKNFSKKQGAFKEALDTAMLQNRAINETIFKNNENWLKSWGSNSTDIQERFYRMLKQLDKQNVEKDIYDSFVDYLIETDVNFATAMTKQDFSDYVKTDQFKEFVETVSVAPGAILRAEKEFNNSYHQATYNTMKKYLKKHGDNLEETYDYIDKVVLNYNGKQFGLDNLDGFLSELFTSRTTSKDYIYKIDSLLGSVGINRSNAHDINKILKSRIKNKNKAIKDLIAKTNKGSSLLEFKDYDKLMQRTSEKINKNSGKALNKVWKEDIPNFNAAKYQHAVDNSVQTIKEAAEKIKSNAAFRFGDGNFKGHKIIYDNTLKDYASISSDGVMHVNKSKIQEGFKNKIWKTNRSLKSLRNYEFSSADEFANFIMLHEYAHTLIPFEDMPFEKGTKLLKDSEAYRIYETQVDKKAMELLKQQQQPVAYVQRTIRLQDLPEHKNVQDLTKRLLKENKTLQKKPELKKVMTELNQLDSFLRTTDRIVNKLDTDPSVAFDIPRWWDSLKRTRRQMDHLQRQLTVHGGPYAVELRANLFRVQEALEVFTEREVVDSLVNYVDNVDGMVQAQLSHLGMFNVLVQHTHLTEDQNLRLFMDQISNPESVYRKQILPNIIDSFERADMPTQAHDFKKVIAQVDTVTNLNKLLDTEIPLSFKISEQLQTDLRTIVFDTIDNHKQYLISDILTDELSNPERVVRSQTYSELQAAMEKIAKESPELTEQEVRALAKEQARTLRQVLRDSIDYGVSSSTVTERIVKETAGIDTKLAKREIKEQLYKILDDYINAQATLNYIDNISLSTLYDLDTVRVLTLADNIRFQLAAHTPNFNIQTLREYDTIMQDFHNFAEAIQMGVDEIQKIDRELAVPLHAYEATLQLRKICESYNLYTGSIESNMFTAKYLIQNSYDAGGKHHTGFIEQFKLTTKDFKGSNEEYLMLSERLWAYRDILHEDYKYKPAYLDRLKKSLILTYERPDALFAPVNPRAYFNSLNENELLAWEVVTKGNLSVNNKTALYHALDINTQVKNYDKLTKADYIAQLEAITRNTGFTDDEAIAHLASIAQDADALHFANRIIDANLMYPLHSLDDLGKYHDTLVDYFKGDVAALDDIYKTITDIINDPVIRTTYEDFGNTADLHNLGGSDYGYSETLYQNQKTMYQERCSAKALSIYNMDAEELATHIYRQTPGALVFHNEGIIKIQSPDGTITWTGVTNPFNFTSKELKDAGLKIKKVTDENGDWYFIRLTDNRVHEKIPTYAALGTTHARVQHKYTNLIDKYRKYLNMYESNDLPANILTAEFLNQDTWNNFINENIDFFGDIEEQKLYQKMTSSGRNNFFEKSFDRLNLAVVGGADTYNIWNGMYSKEYIRKSTQMSSNTIAGLTSAINRSNKINKYLTMFFNNDWALDSPLISTMFSETSDKQIADFFATGKYKVVVLRQDKKGLPKVFSYSVNNKHSLGKATAAGGILVPTETYNAMRQVVNNRLMTNDLLDVYRRVVPTTYKTMYLYTAGFPFRNGLDSLIFKNANELGGITALPKIFRYEREASKALELHNKIQQEVFDATGSETFNKETLLKVLEKHTQEEADVYFLVDIFRESSASGSLSDSMQEFLEEFNTLNGKDIRARWEKFYENKVLYGKQWYNPLHWVHDLNEHIEQTARFGLFLASVDEGLPINESIARVVKTHFDYNAGGDLLDLCERIFWFSTFPINNFNYYINGGLTKSPTMIKLLMDTQVASWNNGEYTYEELKKTNFLAYHAMTGNIRIGNWIVKTSPSLFDFISLVCDPIGNIKSRLNPMISIPLGLEEDKLNAINPLQTQFRLFPKQFTEGNPVPSILSKINEYDWTSVLGKWRSPYTQSSWTKYPRIRKASSYARHLRKYYSRRYRTNVRRFTRTSLYHDAVNYYRIGGRRGVTYREL